MKKLTNVRGTNDLFEELIVHKYYSLIFDYLTYTHGFVEIETPILEYSDVFKKTLGSTSDIIKKETYTFKDRSNNELTLRPEGTAPVIRSFIEKRLNEPLPQKLTYSGPMFRYDRPQSGRYRQFHQLGAEIIGEKDISADLELIYIAKKFTNLLGISDKNFEIHVNSLGDEKGRKKYAIELKDFFQDHKKELTRESLERLKKNPLRILDTKNEKEKKLLIKSPKLKNFLSNESLDTFDEFKEHCKDLKIPIIANDNLVRGLDYYNNICYEFIGKLLGAQNTFLAGGRYDGLIKKMGGPDYPGCGFATGMERIALMDKKFRDKDIMIQGIPPSTLLQSQEDHYAVIVIGKENKIKALKIINILLEDQTSNPDKYNEKRFGPLKFNLICKDNLSKGLKYANGISAGYAIIIGENEISKQQLTIKDLNKQSQKIIKIKDFTKYHLTK